MSDLNSLNIIDDMLRLSYDSIQNLKSDLCRCSRISDTIAINKTIARLSEDIRKLLRIKANFYKEESKNE